MSPDKRFWEKVAKAGDDECWEWQGNKNRLFRMEGRKASPITARRAAWFFMRGDLPKSANIIHTCGNKNCCNPKHLKLRSEKRGKHYRRPEGRAFFTAEERHAIRRQHRAGHSTRALIEKWQADPLAIVRIINAK